MFPVWKAESTQDFCIKVQLYLLRNTFYSKSYYQKNAKNSTGFEMLLCIGLVGWRQKIFKNKAHLRDGEGLLFYFLKFAWKSF